MNFWEENGWWLIGIGTIVVVVILPEVIEELTAKPSKEWVATKKRMKAARKRGDKKEERVIYQKWLDDSWDNAVKGG